MTLAQQIVAKIDAAKAIQALAAKENRDLTADELGQVKANLDAADTLKASEADERAHAEDQSATLARLTAADADLSKARPRRVGGDTSRAAPAVAREAFLDDPMRGFKSHRHFFQAVQAAGSGGRVPENLKCLVMPRAAAGSDEQMGSSDSYGGFLVPKTTLPGVLSIGFDADPFSGMTRKIPMATPEVQINARVDKDHSTSVSGGLLVYRRHEALAGTPKRVQFEQVVLHADSLMGLAYATEEVLRDSPESFAAILGAGFRDEFGAKAMQERLDGVGTGCPVGVNVGAAKVDVSKETGQVAATIVYANLVKMRARCWGYSNSVWYANHDTLPALLSITAPGSTVPLFTQDAMGVDRLFGRPIYFGEFAQTLGTVGDILLVNWGEYLEGEYQPIEGVSSTAVRFVEHEQAFKFTKRNAGSPWWRTVLTPRAGATLAPVVRLATRA